MSVISKSDFFDKLDVARENVRTTVNDVICSGCKHERRCDKTYRRCENKEDIWNLFRNGILGALRKMFEIHEKGDAPRKLYDFAGKEARKIVYNKNYPKPKMIDEILYLAKNKKLRQPRKVKCLECGKEVWPSKIFFSKTHVNAGKCFMCLKGDGYIMIPQNKKAFIGTVTEKPVKNTESVEITKENAGMNKFLGRTGS